MNSIITPTSYSNLIYIAALKLLFTAYLRKKNYLALFIQSISYIDSSVKKCRDRPMYHANDQFVQSTLTTTVTCNSQDLFFSHSNHIL